MQYICPVCVQGQLVDFYQYEYSVMFRRTKSSKIYTLEGDEIVPRVTFVNINVLADGPSVNVFAIIKL